MSERPPGDGDFEHESVEFGRVLAFSDGIFAIAATLLVIDIAVPVLDDTGSVGELADGLNDLMPQFVSFVVGFAVIARYWLAHHQFFGLLAGLSSRLIGFNLVYLGFIAFLPFPTAMLGDYFENPLSVVAYALIIAVISGLEVLLLYISQADGLFRRALPPAVFRYAVTASGTPVLFFLISIPVAFFSTGLAVLCWFAWAPLAPLLDRRRPPEADRLLGR